MDAFGVLQAGGRGVISVLAALYEHPCPRIRGACLIKPHTLSALPVPRTQQMEVRQLRRLEDKIWVFHREGSLGGTQGGPFTPLKYYLLE